MWLCHLCGARADRLRGSVGTFHAHYMAEHHPADLIRRREIAAATPRRFVDGSGRTSSGRGAFTAERQRMREARADD